MSQFPTPTILADRPPFPTNKGAVTPVGLSGVSIAEYGAGAVRQTVITFTNYVQALTDAGANGYAATKLASFPACVHAVLGGVQNLSFVATAGGNCQISTGTTATTDASLAGTEVDLVPASTADATNGDSHKTSATWYNGSVTPTDIYLNVGTAGDPGAGATMTINGTITLTWINFGSRA